MSSGGRLGKSFGLEAPPNPRSTKRETVTMLANRGGKLGDLRSTALSKISPTRKPLVRLEEAKPLVRFEEERVIRPFWDTSRPSLPCPAAWGPVVINLRQQALIKCFKDVLTMTRTPHLNHYSSSPRIDSR